MNFVQYLLLIFVALLAFESVSSLLYTDFDMLVLSRSLLADQPEHHLLEQRYLIPREVAGLDVSLASTRMAQRCTSLDFGTVSPHYMERCTLWYANFPDAIPRQDTSLSTNPLVLYWAVLGDKNRGSFDTALSSLVFLRRRYPDSKLVIREQIETSFFAALSEIESGNITRAQDHLTEMDRLGAEDEWQFFRIYETFTQYGFSDFARTYLDKSRYFHINPLFSDYVHSVIPVLIQNGVVDIPDLQRIHSLLRWLQAENDADWLFQLVVESYSEDQISQFTRALSAELDIHNVSYHGENSEFGARLASVLGVDKDSVNLGNNLVSNGGFELWSEPNHPRDWSWIASTGQEFDKTLVIGGVDDGSKYSGNSAARIMRLWQRNLPEKFPFRSGYSINIKLQAGTEYALGFVYRTNTEDSATTAILFDCLEGVSPGDYYFLPNTEWNWNQFLMVGTGSVVDRCSGETRLFLANFGVGTVWFDEVVLFPVFRDSTDGEISPPIVQIW